MNKDSNNINLTEEDIKTLFDSHEDSQSETVQIASTDPVISPVSIQLESTPPDLIPTESITPNPIIQNIPVDYAPSRMKTEDKYFAPVKQKLDTNYWIWARNIFKTLGLFILIFTISFIVLNFPALWIRFVYASSSNHPVPVTIPVDPIVTMMQAKTNEIYIPKINVSAPVIWNVPENNQMPSLENGVAQYSGTALPGQIGNVFIYGHSSNYWWDKGGYNEIFALLDQLQTSDKIYINYENKVYVYVVTAQKVVSPKDTSVLNPTSTPTLSLMTCVPVGTSLNRLVVTASQLL